MQLLGGSHDFINFFGIGSKTSLVLVVLAEVLCSLFLNFRTFHQICFYSAHYHDVSCGFCVHGNDPFAKQEMALLYLFHYILIFVAGPKYFHRQNDQSKINSKALPSVFFLFPFLEGAFRFSE